MIMTEITKDMGIREILEKKPAAAQVMMDAGLHCLGCAASRFESLEQGCQVHGMDEEQIKKMVKDINEIKEE